MVTPTRILLAVTSGALTLIAVWLWLGSRPERPVYRFVELDPEVEARLFEGRDGSESNVSGRGEFHIGAIDEATARELFPMPPARSEYDADRYYTYKPHLDVRHPWPEHPSGVWFERTNGAGLREEEGATLQGAGTGVLVVGDSHTSGACDNHEAFAARLEGLLSAGGAPGPVEVLNTGSPGYSFYNYLGCVRHFLPDGPQAVVVTVYGGNDFFGVLRMHHFLRGTTYPPRRKNSWDRVQKARELYSSFLAQSINQVLYFQEHPEQVDVALEAAHAVTLEIARLCEEGGVRLVVAYLPPFFEVDNSVLRDSVREVCEVLGVTAGDLFVSRSMGEDFLSGLERWGVEVLDLTWALRSSPEPTYWARDLHINVTGHEVVAHALHTWWSTSAEVSGDARDGPYRRMGEGGVALVEGRFEGGLREGLWVERYPDGTERSRGDWRAGRRDGPWSWWYEDGGAKKRGVYLDERPDGPWTEWYRGGDLRVKGSWAEGKPTGVWREWHPGGQLASEGRYQGGEEEGTWRMFHSDGRVGTLFNYRGGTLEGPAETRHANGELQWRGVYSAGLRQGEWRFGRENGSPSSAGAYEAGKREGAWTFWSRDGSPDTQRSGAYHAGEKVTSPAGSD